MQGYIIRIQPSRDEDLIVTILTENSIQSAYRFYGARHSTINLGYKIDAELITNAKSSMPQLRNILHLAQSWQAKNEKMFFWQQFVTLFYDHLKGIEEIDSFYFELLDEVSQKMEKQNPKRLAIEAYMRLLEHEGRLHQEDTCFLCETKIKGDIALARGFLFAHPECIHTKGIKPNLLHETLENKSTLLLEDEDMETLYAVVVEGF